MTNTTKVRRTNTKWTDADRDLLRTLHQQGESTWNISVRLDRSPGAISQQLYLMKQRDEAEGYVHVVGNVTEIITPPPARTRPELNVLTEEKLRDFRLFEAVISEAYEAENPSLWTRIKQWFRK